MMLPLLLIVAHLTSTTLGGSVCPPKENIYPCSCDNIHQSKNQIHTIVNCHKLKDSDVLRIIFPYLRVMQIDQFHLYDSFHEVKKLGNVEEKKMSLPTDWLSLLKIKEIEIVNSALATCFACDWKLKCNNVVTTRFTAINSISSDRICSLCDTGKDAKKFFPWTGCMTKLEQFHFTHSPLTTIGNNLFPVEMKDLQVLNLTHNQIASIETNAFKNLPGLKMLDLSHNAIIENLNYINFITGLTHLDLSWNKIRTIGDQLFNNASFLNTLKLNYNDITEIKENEWENIPKSLKSIDVSNNPIHCDCSIGWINGTLFKKKVKTFNCETPPKYKGSSFKKIAAAVLKSKECKGTKKA